MSLLSPQPVVDIEDVIVVFVIIPFVVRRLARLCEYSPWVMRRFILELRVAYAVGIGDVRCQLAQGLPYGRILRYSDDMKKKWPRHTDKNAPDASIRRDAGRVLT